MKQRITIDKFNDLKQYRSSEFENGDEILIVQRSSSTNDPDYNICTIQDGVIIDVVGSDKFIVETSNTQQLINLNRGLSRWEFSKNYKYETFLVKR